MVSIDPQGNHPRFIPTGRQHLCCTRTPTESAVGRRHDICVDLVGLGVRGDRDRRVRPDDPGLPHLDLDDDATGARCGRARDLDPWPPRGRPSGWGDPSHRRPVHLGPVLERLAEAGIRASVGTVGDSFDNALAETINGLYKTEVIKHRGRGGPSTRSSTPQPNGRLVQPPQALRVLRRHSASRIGGRLLPSAPAPPSGRSSETPVTRHAGAIHFAQTVRLRSAVTRTRNESPGRGVDCRTCASERVPD